ncbi:hypothetical protein LTS18_012445, partial [Coniosporium uncinatum]
NPSRSPASPELPSSAARGDLTQQQSSPTRWSLTQRIFNFNLRPPQRAHAHSSRLWNPINASPRTPTSERSFPAVPIHHPQIVEGPPQSAGGGRDGDYPLLTLPEQRRSRQSVPGSLV